MTMHQPPVLASPISEVQNERERPEPVRLRWRILHAGSWVASGFALDKLIAAAQLVILARLLTPADFGLMAASAVVLLALMTLSEVGLEPSLVTRREVTEADLSVSWTLSIGRALILAVCLLLFADAIASFFRMPELASLLRVHSLALLIQGAQSPALVMLLRRLDLGRRVRLDLTRRVIEAAATIGLALWLRSVWALLYGQLISFSAACVLSYLIMPFKPRFCLDRRALAQFIHFGKYLNVTAILTFGATCVGEFVVGRMLGVDALGFYQVALAIPLLLGMRLSGVINQVGLPTYAALREDRAGIIRALALQLGVMSLVLAPIATALALISTDLVLWMFGARWIEAAGPLRVLSVFAVCAGLSGVISSLHYGLNRPDLQTRVWAVQFALYALIIVPMTVWFGLVGAAAALSLGYMVGLILQIFSTLRLLGSGAWPAFTASGRGIVLIAAIGCVLAALRLLSPGIMALWTWMGAGLVGATLYALYIWRVEYPRLRELWGGE